jgi:2-oxo-3-hexenedioate decarboxylase
MRAAAFSTKIGELAACLLEAERAARSMEPPSVSRPLSLDEAYQVQRELIAQKLRRDPADRWKGLKAGLTSRAKQKMVNIEEPILGQFLFSNILPGRRLAMDSLIQPRVEPEVALYFGADVSPLVKNAEELLRSVEYVFPALEILDSRFPAYQFTIEDVVADNASTARILLGERLLRPDAVQLSALGVVLSINGIVRETGSAAAVLGHPLTAALWVVRKWAALGGTVAAGSLLLTGGITTAIPIGRGDTVTARFQGWGDLLLHCE